MDKKHLIEFIQELKLDGMKETFEARLTEARSNNLSYEEFLGFLLQDESQIRDVKNLARKIKLAKFEEEKTLESLDCTRYPQGVQKTINYLKVGSYIHEKKNVIILGPTGTGKTHLAQALGHNACRRGKKVKFVRSNNLTSEFEAARADNSVNAVITKYTKTDLLILDDFGLKAMTHTQSCDLYELIANKHINSSFIITSNRKTESWMELFADPVLANAALDRIIHNSFTVVLEGESYRKNFTPKMNKEGCTK